MKITIEQIEEFFTLAIEQNDKEGNDNYSRSEVSQIFRNCLMQIREMATDSQAPINERVKNL